MAADNLIEPFPDAIDRDGFGHWLSGFTDGEGCFGLKWHSGNRRRTIPWADFQIVLRLDDRPVLKLIQSFLGCGSIFENARKARTPGECPIAQFRILKIKSLAGVVVPHFDRYPLRAKKARDFVLWRTAVLLLARPRLQVMRDLTSPSKYSRSDRNHFEDLRQALRSQRRFEAPPAVAVPAPAEERGLFD